jgi:putative flippase GtrA
MLPATPVALPRAALWLGYGGLLPFVGGALLLWLVHAELNPRLAHVMSGYAATIVAFLGGIHWGLAMRQNPPSMTSLAWGVVPALVAWIAVAMQPAAGLVLHGVMLIVCYLVDRRVYPVLGVAAWLVLRFRLSAVASMSCFLAAAATV